MFQIHQTIKIILSLFLILALTNLSIEIWNTSILFAEINEEIENVLDDKQSKEIVLNDPTDSVHYYIKHQSDKLERSNDQFGTTCDYFEIDSPPPELA